MPVRTKEKKHRNVSPVQRKSRGTCLSPPVLPKVWRRPFWMTVESPSRVRSYKKREEGGKKRRFLYQGKGGKKVKTLWCLCESESSPRTPCNSPFNLNTCEAVSLFIIIIMHAGRFFLLCLYASSTIIHHMTHRAGYMRAGGPLAVWPRRNRTSDFLLLPQQLAVLLLSVLHIDQQRYEAVLHLRANTQTNVAL